MKVMTGVLAAAVLPLWTQSAMGVERAQFEAMTQRCAPSVHPDTLAAVIQTESAFNPLAIHLNGDQSRSVIV